MLRRCADKSNPTYGGKGISVCDEWKTFEPFMTWATSSGYADDLTIERVDNSKGYDPGNCTWATSTRQARNRSIVRRTADGTVVADVADAHGVPIAIMNSRICSGGWAPEKAATAPVGSVRAPMPRNPDGTFAKSARPWKRGR